MKCVTCPNTDSSLLKLQTFVDNNTLKEITFVLPDFEIPASQGPVYVCTTCQEQVSAFYIIKKTILKNLCHLNLYKDVLKGTSEEKFNELKIKSVKSENVKFKVNPNCNELLPLTIKDQITEKDCNLSSIDEEPKKQPSSKQREFKCSDCDKIFTTQNKLERHVRIHTGEKPYKCLTCQQRFTTTSNLNKHIRKHALKKPHVCPICHRTFRQESDLIAHEKSHSIVLPYHCPVCDKGFTRSGHLGVHMRIHTGEKPHQCHFCDYRSAESGAMKKHIRIHTGEKPYSCEVCQKSFTQSNTLKEHKRKLHNIEPAK